MQNTGIFHRRLEYDYPHITHGEGVYLFDDKGNKYLDAVGGAAVACLGHGNKEISSYVSRYIDKYSYLHASQFTTSHIEEYGNQLIEVAPEHLTKAFFVSSGSEATEAAVKMAYQYQNALHGHHKRRKVIYTYPGYHGSTLLALSLTGKRRDQESFQNLLTPFPHIKAPINFEKPSDLSELEYGELCASYLEEEIEKQGSESVAAFIVEPVFGASVGVATPPANYLKRVREICDKHGVVLIFDEVMCGFGRSGKWFASEHWGVKSDITICGKGMAGGYFPLSSILCTEKIINKIYEQHGNFRHGHTFSNHQLGTAFAQYVLNFIKEHRLLENVTEQGDYLNSRLQELVNTHPNFAETRGRGLLRGIEIVQDKAKKKSFDRSHAVAENVLQTALKMGVNLYFSTGYRKEQQGDAILFAPPYCVTRQDIDVIIDVLQQSLDKVVSRFN